MMVSLLLSRLLGMLRDTVMFWNFGIHLNTDAYNIAVTIPDMIFMLIAGGGLSSAFIPVFSEFIYTDREEEAWKLFSVVMTICTLVVTTLIVLAWIFAPQIAGFMAGDKDPKIIPEVTRLGRIMLPAQFAFLIGSVLLGTLYARKRFLAPGLAPNVYNVGIILGALIGGGSTLGIAGMAWGALIGAVIGNLLLPTLFMIGYGGWLRPSLDFQAPGVKKFFNLLLPVILGFSLPSVCALITQRFASEYSTGINSIMRSSNNLMMAPLGIFGHSLALAAFPVLSQFFAQKKMNMYRDQVSKTMRTTIYLSVPAGALMLALAPQIVNLVYANGKAAGQSSSLGDITASLPVFSLAIWAWCVQPIWMRGFFSIHQTARPVIIGTAMTAIFIAMCYFTLHTSIGFLALPLVTDVAAIVLVIALYFGLEKQVGALDRRGIGVTLIKSAAGSAVMGGVAYGVFHFVPSGLHKVPLLLTFLFVCCVVGWIYFFVTRALKMPETDYLARAFNRLQSKKA